MEETHQVACSESLYTWGSSVSMTLHTFTKLSPALSGCAQRLVGLQEAVAVRASGLNERQTVVGACVGPLCSVAQVSSVERGCISSE